jgi:pimeloyl-ACP methyl ester carboxylesterase
MSVIRPPAVFLLGWLGCKQRHLQHIARFYDGLGVDCVTFTENPISLLRFRSGKSATDALYQKALNRPVIFHSFSLTGASALVKAFAGTRLDFKPEIDVRGLILDSSPGHVNSALPIRGFATVAFPNSPKLAKLAQIVVGPLFNLVVNMSDSTDFGKRVSAEIYAKPCTLPTLLLASEKDEIIPYKDIIEYGEAVAKAGGTVQTKIWPDSGHIRMSKDHPEEYKQLVRAFVQKNLLSQK